MKKRHKLWLIILFTIIYILSPIDLLPGIPIDDIIVGILGTIYSIYIGTKR